MKKVDKMNWILNYIRNSKVKIIDIFDEDFVNLYIEECKPNKVFCRIYGASSVPEIGKYLAEMYRLGILDRTVLPLNYSRDGYPKWCYIYWEEKIINQNCNL